MAINSVLLSIGAFIVKGVIAVAKGVAIAAGSAATKFIFGGVAIAASALTAKNSSRNSIDSSPTYQGIQYTQTNPDLPLPIVYGTVRTAGNTIWQENKDEFSRKIIAFSEGEITAFTDIRINDIPVSTIEGAQIERFYGTNDQLIATIAPGGSQTEKAANVGSLKNVAYLALTVFNDDKITSAYNLTAVIVGKKIRVYSSPTQYTVQYSENPAWILLDFLTSYNGLGLALNQNSQIDDTLITKIFDMNSFLEAAAYCDELVYGLPRFTFNMIFDSQTSVRNLLDEIYRSCRGGLFFKNGLLQFKIDKAEYISKVFTANDISNEVFKSVSAEEHYDILKCVYISPEHEWQKVEAFAEIPEYRNGIPVEHSVNIYSCTNFYQASRLAWYYSNSKVLQPYYGSFDTDYRAYDIEVGDVIQFDSILMGLNAYTVKVTQITDDGCGTYNISWQTYDERLYADTLGSLEPRVLVTKLNDLYVYPPDVTNFNVVQSADNLNFSWDKTENLTWEIRQGNDWASAKIIASDIYDNFYSCKIDSTGFFKFLIKAKNKYNYSENPAIDALSVEYVPEQNIVLQQKILNSNGLFYNTYLYNGILKLKTENLFWENLIGVWNDVELENYSVHNLWGGKTFDNGWFTSEIFDLGRVFNNISSVDYNALGNYEILFRYADDLTSLEEKAFVTFAKGEYSFRYFQVKIVLKATVNTFSHISDFVFNIDVPDKTASYSIEITDANNGFNLDYSDAGFYSVPGIVATVTDSIYAYASTADKTPTAAKIYAINNDGTKTTAKIDVQLFGY